MRQLKRLSLLVLGCLTSVAIPFLLHSPIQAQESIQLQATPALNQVVPATEPVRLRLTLTDANHQPLPPAQVQVKLFTPSGVTQLKEVEAKERSDRSAQLHERC